MTHSKTTLPHQRGSKTAEPFPKEKIDSLLQEAHNLKRSTIEGKATLGIFILLALETGLRIGDLQRLTIEHFNELKNDKVFGAYAYNLKGKRPFNEQKTGKPSNASISVELYETLQSFLNDRHKKFKTPKNYPFLYTERTKRSWENKGKTVSLEDVFGFEELILVNGEKKTKYHSPTITRNRHWVKTSLEGLAKKMGLSSSTLSAHSLRKTSSAILFSQVYRTGGMFTIADQSEYFSHSSLMVTQKYMGNAREDDPSVRIAKLRYGVK
jgi:integrase